MTADDIIYDWVQVNYDKLPTVTYSKEVIEFIEGCYPTIVIIEDRKVKETVYCINNFYQKIQTVEAYENNKIEAGRSKIAC